MSDETVYTISNPSGGRVACMHSDKDCPRLRASTGEIREKTRAMVASHRKECQWCIDHQPYVADENTQTTRHMLLSMDPDEVGGGA